MAAADVSLAEGAELLPLVRLRARTYQIPLQLQDVNLYVGAGTKQQTLLTQAISLAPWKGIYIKNKRGGTHL